MNFIKFDQYDHMYFAYLEHKYELFKSLPLSYNKMIDRDLLFDLYNMLFKEYVEVLPVREQDVPRNDYVKFLLINKLLHSNYLAKIKYYTVFNEQNSFLFIKNLLNTFKNYSMWEEDEAENGEQLLRQTASSNRGDSSAAQNEAQQNDAGGGGSSPTAPASSAPAAENNNPAAQLSDYLTANASSLQNLAQWDSLPEYDKLKAMNDVYELNKVLDGLKKPPREIKPPALQPPAGEPASRAKEQSALNYGARANQMVVAEMDRIMRLVSMKLEQDLQKKQALYQQLKKLSSHNYWDLALGNLVQTNPEFCFYLSGLLKNHPEIIKIARIMGNLKAMKTKKDKRMISSTYECKMNIAASDDITNLIPLELLYLDEQLENIFYNKLLEHKLFTYDYQARKSKGRGGIIAILDTSGSMIGNKLELLKAIILNLALIVLQRKRYFALINFSSSMQDVLLLPHRPMFQEFVSLLVSSYYGGTNFDIPIKRAVDIIKDFRFHRESDILIFSDGFGKLSAAVLDKLAAAKHKYRFGLFGFLLDDQSQDTALAKSCDRVFALTSSQLLKDLLQQLEKTI
ncbi:MAG: VWA domain-containing protein [Firmicutes bacterium]|nr:VWA domain-containing protein [Bacillota bacterium]